MGQRYRYNPDDAKRAGERTAGQLRALTAQLKAQAARGVNYFIGDQLSALDIYWVVFANLLDPLPKAQCPIPDEMRPMFPATDPQITAALDPILFAHRDRIFQQYFRSPMEF